MKHKRLNRDGYVYRVKWEIRGKDGCKFLEEKEELW